MGMKLEEKISKVERILEEIKSGLKSQPKDVDLDKIADIVYKRVVDKISREGMKITLPPAEYILNKFQENEVKRWEEKLEELDLDEKKIGAFIIALNRQTTRKEILGKVFGASYISGELYMAYTKKIDKLIELGIIRTDKAGRIYPAIEESVRNTLETYSPSEEKIQEVMDRIKRIFIEKIEEENGAE
jgi:intergrase/recombinase